MQGLWIPSTPLERYRMCLAVAAALIFFSRLDYFLYDKVWVIPPLWWMVAIGTLAMRVAAADALAGTFRPQGAAAWYACVWVVAAVVFGFIWYLQGYGTQPMKTAVLSGLLLLLFSLLFRGPAVKAAGVAVGMVTGLSVAANALEMLAAPGLFSGMSWRAAGLYINPNGSAIAVLLGLILTLPVIAHGRRILWIALCGFGIGLTLSRAGALCWLLALVFLAFRRDISWRGLAVAAVVAIGLTGTTLAISGATKVPDAKDRLGVQLDDFSARERSKLYSEGIALALKAPVTGNGLGVFSKDGAAGFPHNLYLRLWAEMGLVGLALALVFPLLPLAGKWGEGARFAPVFSLVLAVWALFDHNVIENQMILVAVALMTSSRLGAAEVRPA